MRENQQKYENIIHAQRILDEIAGEKIERVMWPFDAPDEGIKAERHQHPNRGPLSRSAHAEFPAASLEREQVDSDCDEDADVKRNPKPNARPHGGQVFMPRGARQSQIARGAWTAYTSHRETYAPIDGS